MRFNITTVMIKAFGAKSGEGIFKGLKITLQVVLIGG